MDIRRLAGLMLAALAGWLLWGGVHSAMLDISRGNTLAGTLMSPPTGVLRIAGTAIALIGGLLAFLRLPFGALVSLVGTAIFLLMTAALILSGPTYFPLWWDEAACSGAMVVLTGLLLSQPRD